MDVDEWIGLIAVLSVITLPALAITARLALKPIVEAVIRLSEAGTPPRLSGGADAESMQRVLDEMEELQRRVAQLETENAFHRELAKSNPAASKPAVAPKSQG